MLVPVKTGATDGFRIEAHDGATGNKLWQKKTDFVFAPHDWAPSFPAHLTAQNRLYYAGAGGTVYVRDTPDMAAGATGQLAFYGKREYKQNKAAYDQRVMIDTPITADGGRQHLFRLLRDGLDAGRAGERHRAHRAPTAREAGLRRTRPAGDGSILEVVQNCAPAVSNDGSTIYVGVSDGGTGYLLGLDKRHPGDEVQGAAQGSAVRRRRVPLRRRLGEPDRRPRRRRVLRRGRERARRAQRPRLAAALQRRSGGKKTPGSFGWDDTVSVVPTSMVPSYTGTSPYLLMTKYNNYLGFGNGNGHNEIAIISPDETQKDRFSNVTVMKEIMTKLNPSHVPGQPSGAVYEWCINSAAVDVAGRAVIANAEDGHTYRWDLAKNTLTDIALNPPRGEAYTPTVIGPDGTTYAINDAKLYALGK